MMSCIFFIGAGASVPFGVPTMTKMVQDFETWMEKPHYALKYVVDEIKNQLSDYKFYDIEALITVLQDIINYEKRSETLYNHPSIHFFSPVKYKTFIESISTLGSRYHKEATQILGDLRNFIVDACGIRNDPFELYKELFIRCLTRHGFNYEEALKTAKTRNISNEIFTTNYDLVLEAYCSKYDIQYETGELKGKLDLSIHTPYLYSSPSHSIFKLHGSINWYSDENGTMRYSSEPIKIGSKTSFGYKVAKELLVYPAYLKYTFREPFYTMFHHLKDRLLVCNMCVVVGYSFRDDDILGLFLDSMLINKSLYLVIIDPNANNIKSEKFNEFNDRIIIIPQEFSGESVKQIDNIIY